MAKGDAPGPVQTTTVQNKPQKNLVKLAMPWANEFANSGGMKMPDFSLIAGFDPLQTQGQEMILNSTGTQGDIVNSAATGNQFFTSGDVLRPESNPALQATINAATRPITEQLTESILPKIRNTAVSTGNFGSSRQGIAEGIASGRASQAVGDTSAKIATQGYLSGLDAMGKGLQLAPSIATAQNIPGLATSGVGDVRRALSQAILGEQGQRFNFDQMMPLLMARELMGLAQGVPGGTTVSSATNPTATPEWMQWAGLGAQGLGAAGSAMYGLSQLLPVLAASDRQLKEDIVRVGELYDGTPVFSYRYKGDVTRTIRFGLMSDSVVPEAVHKRNGFDFVDYGRALEKAIEMGRPE